MRKFNVTLEIGPSNQFPFCLSDDRAFKGTDCLPSRNWRDMDFDDRSIPRDCRTLRLISRS